MTSHTRPAVCLAQMGYAIQCALENMRDAHRDAAGAVGYALDESGIPTDDTLATAGVWARMYLRDGLVSYCPTHGHEHAIERP